MDDDSSFEDFSESLSVNSIEDEVPKKDVKKEDNPFEILSMERILEDVYSKVADVRSFTELLGTNVAFRVLLTHYKWDQTRLITEYFELGQDLFFEQAKEINPLTLFECMPMSNVTENSSLCKICCDDSCEDMYSLDCGHKFCRDCWGQYLTTKIEEAGLTQLILCLEPKCDFLVDDEHILLLVNNQEIIEKYQRSMTNAFVQHNKDLRWCPSVGCSFAAKKKRAIKRPCRCECGFEFCFDCTAEYWHEPVTCIQLKQWKNSSDTETYKWIVEHAKPCPNCDSNIEKNGGCNHMTCRNCRHEFCWICMKNWRGHSACNRFDETTSRFHREVERYKHFQDRYGNQLESLRLEGNLYRDLDAKVNHLKHEFEMTNNEVRFFRDAVRVLLVSRRTLTYTFVFAYFLRKNNQVEIFEDNQSDLESAVERLSGYMEQEMTPKNVVALKRNIQESFKYCEQRCDVLMDHIREAEEKGLWQMD